ncbi:hypothetical protein [Flagellimonas pacifica]|uniref:Uncharacterized protein n=1 Tax=Flagellimonas pacifica TaxID=1247520 RepID=A0A285MVE9_9FLAO|nr:hypothetical protein [Allomuricauda parva]SNZ01164.1 hypothetical protein SAMN06265377_2997 [Allomuricauda parva]
MLIKKVITILCILTIVFSCKNKLQENEKLNETEQQQEIEAKNAKIGRQNYAIAWKWATDNKQLVEENLVVIADQVNQLWKEDIIADAYYNSNATIDKFEYFPNVFFFLKAQSEEDAITILDELTLVKKGIASYKIYPVGLKWMGRDHDEIREKGITNSYAAVWASDNWENTTDSLTKSQADAILDLWNDGSIENIYFDIEGTQKANDKTDFVFFINANTEKEAKELCAALPFAKENIANYEIYPVGVFWLGDFKEFNKE